MMIETANAYDKRYECSVCHESKSGSLARGWAMDHDCERVLRVQMIETSYATGQIDNWTSTWSEPVERWYLVDERSIIRSAAFATEAEAIAALQS